MQKKESVLNEKITFVAAVNDPHVLKSNFLASPCLQGPPDHEILVQENFTSAAKAYNDALARSSNDLIIFCHQDVYLPVGWLSDVGAALDQLEVVDPNWGVLGCSGKAVGGHHPRFLYSVGLGISGKPLACPEAVQTLDEMVLILRKSSGLRFDECLPHFHLYGADICLRAADQRMKTYVISAFCVHNTQQGLILPPEFYECCRHIKQVWRDRLPIQTTCIRITRSGIPIYARRLREKYLRHVGRARFARGRIEDPGRLVAECVEAVPPLTRSQRDSDPIRGTKLLN